MAFQTVFKRYELKYLLTAQQKEAVMAAMRERMVPDQYGMTTIRNLYFDTPTYLLIRRSLERPVYKEKLRVRSYAQTGPDSTVFVELKKKYRHVVYKRRISLPETAAMDWLTRQGPKPKDTQIADEVDYFCRYYGSLRPAVYLSYDRQAWYAKDDPLFRVTLDENILFRQEDLSLAAPVWGTALLPEGRVLMEIKCAGGIPMWMTQVLTREKIYKTTFSKYGTAYQSYILPQQMAAEQAFEEVKYHA